MRQLMQNLIGNALKFKKPDVSPVVTVSAEMVSDHSLDLPLGEKALRITIADNGIGFDNQFREQIFTIFQRLHSRNEYEGTGIGLATVRKIVERHKGSIFADGTPGEGAKFLITIPQFQTIAKEIAA
jgi:light-regulated signal transduction histidine kinase (bacteriophytochrome)